MTFLNAFAIDRQAALKSIMRVVESLVGRASEGFKTLIRGYSLRDVKNAQRIVYGQITQEDRETYRRDERIRLSSMFLPPSITTVSGQSFEVTIYPPEAIQKYKEAVLDIDELLDEEINQRLTTNSQKKLEKWGYPIPR